MVSMALAINFGLDSATHYQKFASPPIACGVVGATHADGGGLPNLSPAVSWPRAGAVDSGKGRRYSLDRQQTGAADSRYGDSSSISSCACRRVRCGAELKTCSSVEMEEDQGQDAVLRPTLGWPFFGVSPSDFSSSEKKVSRVQLSEPWVLERDHEQHDDASDFFDHGGRSGEFLYRHWIATEFKAAVQSGSPPPRQKEESQAERDNYYVNTGYAIRTLREELPNLFYKRLNFDIYRDDITFRDPMNTFSGIDNYKLIFWALRFHGRIFFKALWVDINRVWQPHDKVIMVRWTVRGIPRVPWEAHGHFEGTSEYKLDKEGKIYEHKVDNVIFNSPTRYHAPSVLDLVRAAAANTNPTPSFCGRVTLFLLVVSPYLKQFTWVRFYWALKSTLALNNPGNRCDQLGLNA
ncbi:hypothetical protein R1sor_009908 [Riccia sorocarpa]|uniref:Uncharacterized protein n=1 Tax=Riccia sorocarpa TaxID=122646 RepID=A0ABD3I030_9MARC